MPWIPDSKVQVVLIISKVVFFQRDFSNTPHLDKLIHLTGEGTGLVEMHRIYFSFIFQMWTCLAIISQEVCLCMCGCACVDVHVWVCTCGCARVGVHVWVCTCGCAYV